MSKVKVAIATVGLVAGLGAFGTAMGVSLNNAANYDGQVKKFVESIDNKVYSDIKAGDVFDFDRDNLTYSFMSCETGSSLETRTEQKNSFNIFGTIIDAKSKETGVKSNVAFKAKYNVEEANFNDLKDLENFNTKFDDMFVLDDIDYSDEYALTFGFTSDKEIDTFKETLEIRQKLEAPKAFSNIDVLVPIYSKAEIVEKNGQNFARLKLYGIEGKTKKEKNVTMGVAMGLFAYNSASSSSTYSSMAMPIALTTGIAASELFKTSKVDSRYFSQTYEMPVYEDNFETESDLRKYMIDNLNDGKDMYFTMNAWSKNLNNAKIEKKINEEILK